MEWEGKTTHQKVTGFIKCQVLSLDLKKKKKKNIKKDWNSESRIHT